MENRLTPIANPTRPHALAAAIEYAALHKGCSGPEALCCWEVDDPPLSMDRWCLPCLAQITPRVIRELADECDGRIASMAWRPIDTAPKDGTNVLLGAWIRDHEWISDVGKWWTLTYADPGWGWSGPVSPTHWMPLPAEPVR